MAHEPRTELRSVLRHFPARQNPGEDPNKEEEALKQLCTLTSVIPSETLLLKCIEAIASIFGTNTEVIQRKVNSILRQIKRLH